MLYNLKAADWTQMHGSVRKYRSLYLQDAVAAIITHQLVYRRSEYFADPPLANGMVAGRS